MRLDSDKLPQKDKEIYAVLERIRSDDRLSGLFHAEKDQNLSSVEASDAAQGLQGLAPEVHGTIESWSMKYKLVREHMDSPSDTMEYIADISKRLKAANAMTIEMLVNFYRIFMDDFGLPEAALDDVDRLDKDLFLLIMSHARAIAAKAKYPGWDGLSNRKKAEALGQVTLQEIEPCLPRAFQEIKEATAADKDLRKTAGEMLRAYPELKEMLAASKMQVTLREDGHHLIVPHQRKISRMMLELAQRFVPDTLEKPEDIFNVSTDELIALLRESDPRYITKSFKRWQLLKEAELKLNKKWSLQKGSLNDLGLNSPDIWKDLVDRGYIYSDGTLKEKARRLHSFDELEISDQFSHARPKIFTALREPINNISLAITEFSEAVEEACIILDRQIEASSVPRVIESYKAEQKRLRERVERMFRLARESSSLN